MRTPRVIALARAVLAAALLMAPGARPAAAAPKTDLVHLRNGDRITGEVKGLDRARLRIKTDPMSTLTVRWDDVAGLVSGRDFEVELRSGALHYGQLASVSPGELTILVSDGTRSTLALADVTRLTPIGGSVWNRIDGNVDLGFSFAQAALETRWTLNADTVYRGPKYTLHGSLASQLTAREDATPLSRNTLTLSSRRSVSKRGYLIGVGQMQQNEELDLDLRALVGGGAGHDFSRTNYRIVSGYVGLVYTHEQFSGEPTDRIAEAAIGGNLDFFSPGNEDLDISNAVVTYYQLGGRGRMRIELQSAIRRKFFKDFYWSINVFESFDASPPGDQKKNDAGVTIALGWSF